MCYHDNSKCDGCDDENVMCIVVGNQLLCCDCARISEELADEFAPEDDIDGDYAGYDEFLDGQPSEYDEWQDYMGGDDSYNDIEMGMYDD